MVWALLALAAGGDFRSSIAWADRLYRQALPFPSAFRDDEVALDAYRQVVRRFPRESVAEVGKGRCYLTAGYYREAADAFLQAGPSGARLLREAWPRERLSKEVATWFPGRRCPQVERIPGFRSRWLALLCRPIHDGAFFRPLIGESIVQLFDVRREGKLVRVGKPVSLPKYLDGWRSTIVRVLRLGARGPVAAVVYQTYVAGDCTPNEQHVFRLTRDRLSRIQDFSGIAEAQVVLASFDHGLRFKVFATWKVGWPDVYEWRHGAFRFANRQNPELYRSNLGPQASGEDYYPTWMERAALADIPGDFRRGDSLWRKAERMCLDLVRKNRDVPFAGHSRENLREIRERRYWIRHRQYSHWLLYRPYDWGLEIPPYRLGSADGADN